jgi:hypothetical protein
MMCAWFWAWAAVGALGVLSLDVGPLAAAPALVLGAAIARNETARRSAFGLVSGAGLSLLLVAYVQREGPGTICYRTATARGCDQRLSPLPWLVVGVVLVLAGLLAQTDDADR